MTEETELHQILTRLYEQRGQERAISPAWLATEAMIELDPERVSPHRVYIAAHLELRQLARGICRKRSEPESEATEQHEMFPFLQRRYPEARSANTEEPQYVLLEHLTADDVKFNVQRLRSEASTKLAHADALEAWWQNRAEAAA